ncbi:MAG: hypothetical protein KDJ52_23010 [Anaerolineae bacterium]|nr:hypothetical protein [Anaerolineae bacterium]
MPRLSIWFIRAALLYLAAGVTVGGLLLGNKGLPVTPWLWLVLPLHVEFLLFGWIMQLVLGVAFWIFPRFWRSRGNVTPAWIAFGLLNAGVWLAGLAPILGNSAWLLLLGRLAEAGAALAFGLHIWSRIKPPGITAPPGG